LVRSVLLKKYSYANFDLEQMYTLPPGAPKPPPVVNSSSYTLNPPFGQSQFNNTAYIPNGGGIPKMSPVMPQNMPPPPVSMPTNQQFTNGAANTTFNKRNLLLCLLFFTLRYG
jgi:hypothetical protein